MTKKKNKKLINSIQEFSKTKKASRTRYLRKTDFIILVLMSVFTFILYSNTLHYPFHFDDEVTILENTKLHIDTISPNLISGIYDGDFGHRPLPMLSFSINYYYGKNNSFGYHFVNILIHILNGVLIYFISQKTIYLLADQSMNIKNKQTKNIDIYIPLFSSLIWLVHPLQTNSVTYIVQRMNSMATFFFLLTMLFYIKGRYIQVKASNSIKEKRKKKYHHILCFAVSIFTCLLAFGSKEIAITLPFFIVLYEIYFFQNLNKNVIIRSLAVIISLIILMMIIFKIFNGFEFITWYFNMYYEGFSFTMFQRVLTEFRVVIYYLSLLLFPHPDRLNFDYDFPISHSLLDPYTTVLSLFTIIGLSAFAFLGAKKERLVSFGILWFLGNLAIESSIIPLDIIFEHRTYLPSIFVSFIFVMMIWRFLPTDKYSIGILSVLVMLLSFWTFQRNSVWQTPISLWQDCVQKSPNKDRTHANLGRSLEMAGRIDEAILEYQKALRINPYHQFALRNLGLALYRKGNLDESIFYYKKALKRDPNLAEAHNDLGVALIDKRLLEEGIFHYKKAIKLKPNHPQASMNLKKAVNGLNKINAKISQLLKETEIIPNQPSHYIRLGFLYHQKGKFEEAIHYYNRALAIEPENINALKGIGAILTEQKKYDSAISIFNQVLKLQPQNGDIYYNIACIYSLQNKKKEAITYLKNAIDNGYTKWEKIKTDRDLNNVRKTRDFLNMVQ